MVRVALVMAVIVLAGCGGTEPEPRAEFLGSWKGPDSSTVTSAGRSTALNGEETATITASSEQDKIVIALTGGCSFKATVKDGTSFTVDPGGSCTQSGGGCTQTLSISSGSGTRTGSNLRLSLSVNQAITCSDGSSATGVMNYTLEAAKQ